jgi:hypothetical protein
VAGPAVAESVVFEVAVAASGAFDLFDSEVAGFGSGVGSAVVAVVEELDFPSVDRGCEPHDLGDVTVVGAELKPHVEVPARMSGVNALPVDVGELLGNVRGCDGVLVGVKAARCFHSRSRSRVQFRRSALRAS